MTWKKVILFAVVIAIVTAAFLNLPFTIDTSLANIGVYPEFWVLCALVIIMNCKGYLEAGLKTFVFFLISQPLIYLFQVPFSWLGWQIFMYYPRWFIITLFTFPGAMIAYFVKKDNILSAFILSGACALLGYSGVYFLASTLNHFPKYLLSTLFCFALAYVLITTLLKQKRNRIIATIITLLVIGFGFYREFLLMGFAF